MRRNPSDRFATLPTAELEDLLRHPGTAAADLEAIRDELERRYAAEFAGHPPVSPPPRPAPPPPRPAPAPRAAPPPGMASPPPPAAPPSGVAWAPVTAPSPAVQPPVAPPPRRRRGLGLVVVLVLLGLAAGGAALVAARYPGTDGSGSITPELVSQPCLVGTWRLLSATNDDGTVSRVTAGAMTYTFSAAGTGTLVGDATMTGPNGVQVRATGRALFGYTTSGSTITTRASAVEGFTDMFVNGAHQQRLPFWEDDNAVPLSCSSSTLQYGPFQLVRA